MKVIRLTDASLLLASDQDRDKCFIWWL